MQLQLSRKLGVGLVALTLLTTFSSGLSGELASANPSKGATNAPV